MNIPDGIEILPTNYNPEDVIKDVEIRIAKNEGMFLDLCKTYKTLANVQPSQFSYNYYLARIRELEVFLGELKTAHNLHKPII